jgi:hypothetical protein
MESGYQGHHRSFAIGGAKRASGQERKMNFAPTKGREILA